MQHCALHQGHDHETRVMGVVHGTTGSATHACGADSGTQQNNTAHSTTGHTPSTAIQSIAERSDAQTHSAVQCTHIHTLQQHRAVQHLGPWSQRRRTHEMR